MNRQRTCPMYCLETTNLVYRYHHDVVLDDVNLQVPSGSIYGFLGPNGAGKTTTLRLALGLLRKQQGTVSIFGKPFDAHRIETLKNIGALIESPSLYDHLTAVENLRILQKIYRVADARIAEVLEIVGLSSTASKVVSKFSLGMKQRLGIAAALLNNPSLLILDEPTNGLDPNGIVEIRDLLTRLNVQQGTSIVVSSHLLTEIEKLVTHLGIIRGGRLMFQGTLDELKQKQQLAGSVSLRTSDDANALKIITENFVAARIVNGKIIMPGMSKDRIAGINRRLVQEGLDVHQLYTTGDDLEAIFMDMVEN